MTDPAFALLLAATILLTVGCSPQFGPDREWPMGPKEGDIYREYTYARRFGEVDPKATAPRAQGMKAKAGRPRRVDIDDLKGAIGAEVSVQYWGGHSGTAGQRFSVNQGQWLPIPQPAGTATAPQCYYRTILGDNPVQISLDSLIEGSNVLQFAAGRQIRHSFGWGFYWVYSYTVRVYYGPNTPHISGTVIAPASATVIGDNPTITAKINAKDNEVKQVDFLALYDDFDWEGNGIFRQWHWQFKDGIVARHLGTASNPPWSVIWNTTWVPDQHKPMSIMARVVAKDGTVYMTPAVNDVVLSRKDRSVKMYPASKVPEVFGVRVGKKKSCAIDIPDNLEHARQAKLLLSTWSAAHAEEIGLNDKMLVERVGLVHNVSFDTIPVPTELLDKHNQFYDYSSTEEHSAEINWPGPDLLVEFDKAPAEAGPEEAASQAKPTPKSPD